MGKRIEVLWKYFDKDSNKPHMIWSTGTVKLIADGLTDKRTSPRARSILPGGALLWAWDADPEYDEPAGENGSFCCHSDGTSTCNTPGATIHASWCHRAVRRRRQPGLEWSAKCQMMTI